MQKIVIIPLTLALLLLAGGCCWSKSGPMSFIRSSWRVADDPRLAEFRWCDEAADDEPPDPACPPRETAERFRTGATTESTVVRGLWLRELPLLDGVVEPRFELQ